MKTKTKVTYALIIRGSSGFVGLIIQPIMFLAYEDDKRYCAAPLEALMDFFDGSPRPCGAWANGFGQFLGFLEKLLQRVMAADIR